MQNLSHANIYTYLNRQDTASRRLKACESRGKYRKQLIFRQVKTA